MKGFLIMLKIEIDDNNTLSNVDYKLASIWPLAEALALFVTQISYDQFVKDKNLTPEEQKNILLLLRQNHSDLISKFSCDLLRLNN